MAAKSGGKQFLRKVTSTLCIYPVNKKFRWNRYISLRFLNKWVFVINAEIQDGSQKCRENNFCKMSPAYSADTL